MICENYWFRVRTELENINLATASMEEVTERVNCTREATTTAFDDFTQQNLSVCEECNKTIELVNWLHTPEGKIVLEELDPWNDDDEN